LAYGRYLAGRVPAGEDIVLQYLPYQRLVWETVGSGRLPWWNPMTFCGRPLLADIQVGIFYPPNWLHGFLPLPWGFGLLLLGHTLWAEIGWYRLGRRWGLTRPSATLLAILVVFSGFMTSKLLAGVILFHYAAAWLPWLGLGLERLWRGPSSAGVAGMGLTVAMSILAGSPQITFYAGLILLIWGWSRRPAAEAGSVRRWGALGLALLLGIGLAAFQLWQTRSMISVSFDRGAGASWDYVTEGSLAPRLLLLLFNPGVFGPGQDSAYYWGSAVGFSETHGYLTVWALALLLPIGAYLSLRRGGRAESPPLTSMVTFRARRRLLLGALVMMIGGVVLGLGRFSPAFRALYAFVPGFDQFRVPARLMFLFTVGAAMAAALGFDGLLRLKRGSAEATAVVRIVLLGLTAAVAFGLVLVRSRSALWVLWEAPFTLIEEAARKSEVESRLSRTIIFEALRGLGFAALAASAIIAALRTPRARGASDTRVRWLPLLQSRLAPWSIPLWAALELAWASWPLQPTTRADTFLEAHYPRSDLVDALAADHRGGRLLWLDDLLDWRLDQNQPEVLRNALIMQRLPDARGYDPVNARWMATWMNRLAGLPPTANPRGSMIVPRLALPSWLTLMGVETVLSYDDLSAAPGLGLSRVITFRSGQSLGVWRNTAYRGLAFAAPDGPVIPDRDGAQALSARLAEANPTDPLKAIVYQEPLSAPRERPATKIDEQFVVEPAGESGGTYHFNVTFPEAATMVFAMSAYPGWIARVDGRPAPLTLAAGTFLAAPVPSGQHVVTFDYRPPPGSGPAAALSLASLAVMIGTFALGRRRREGNRVNAAMS